jgi:Rieske Fe-S protein
VTARDGWTERTDVQTVWVLRPQEDAIQVLTAICPHLGCSVQWKAARGAFACPCHDSEFAPDGARRHGPARRGMDPLPVRITHGEVQVRWVEFVAGAAERRTTDGSPVDGQGTA